MNNVFNTNVARISQLSELANAANDVVTSLTETVIHFTNSVIHFLHNNFNSTLDSRTAIMAQIITDSAVKELLQNLSYSNANSIKTTLKSFFENIDGMDDNGMRRVEHAPQLTTSAWIKVYVLSFMALFSLVGNMLTMWNIFKTRISRRTSQQNWSAIYFLIFHLSIADLLVTGFCIIGEAAWCYTVAWVAGNLSCKLVKFFQMFSLYVSTYVLVLIGVDRWIAVKYPIKSLSMAKRCHRFLWGIYGLSFFLSLPQLFIFHTARGPFIEEFYQCVTHGFYTAAWQEQFYTTFTLIFTFILPLDSEKIFQNSTQDACTTQPLRQSNRQRLIHKAKMKSFRISVVIIIAFLVCWTPYYVMMVIFMFWNPDERLGEDLQSAIFCFGMSNSLINPLIYGAFHLRPTKKTIKKNRNNDLNNGGGGDNVIKNDVELTQKSVMLSSSTKTPILLRQLSSEATQSKRHYSSQRRKSNEIVQTEEESLKEKQKLYCESILSPSLSSHLPDLERVHSIALIQLAYDNFSSYFTVCMSCVKRTFAMPHQQTITGIKQDIKAIFVANSDVTAKLHKPFFP
uniref:G-protein coupled receptors family 1 profile domain-containing protein n=1 Tax=Glossina pallidipes TaxID=7398 RepID=A0A1A9ZG33_GLOPL